MRVELIGGPRAPVEVVEVPDGVGESLRITAPNYLNGQVSESPIAGNIVERYRLEQTATGSEDHTVRYRFSGYGT